MRRLFTHSPTHTGHKGRRMSNYIEVTLDLDDHLDDVTKFMIDNADAYLLSRMYQSLGSGERNAFLENEDLIDKYEGLADTVQELIEDGSMPFSALLTPGVEQKILEEMERRPNEWKELISKCIETRLGKLLDGKHSVAESEARIEQLRNMPGSELHGYMEVYGVSPFMLDEFDRTAVATMIERKERRLAALEERTLTRLAIEAKKREDEQRKQEAQSGGADVQTGG